MTYHPPPRTPARSLSLSGAVKEALDDRERHGEAPIAARVTVDERGQVEAIDAETEAALMVDAADRRFGRSRASSIRSHAERMRAVANGLEKIAAGREVEEQRAAGKGFGEIVGFSLEDLDVTPKQ